MPAPSEYSIGGDLNYYFSHMLNCIYDCRYCFLQGMYRSANYVLFVNYEEFYQQIKLICNSHADKSCHFFSGYDCDSLAMEPVTGFMQYLLPKNIRHTQSITGIKDKKHSNSFIAGY